MSKRKSAPGPTRSPLETALERYRPLLTEEDYNLLLAELARPLHTSLRLNPLKVDPHAALADYAARYGWEVRPVPYCPTGWWIPSSRVPPSQAAEHRLGFYYIQDAASMLPVELFDFDPGSRPLVLDMAASPGGKTTHITARTGDQGLVIANDSSQSRITALRIVLENWGAVSAAVTRFPGESFGQWFPETFDRILLDAPCSMQGLRSTESHPMRPITDKEQAGLAVRQQRLLESALRAVKTGGQVVYSTCTLAPEEDEAVLDAVFSAFPGAVEIVDLSTRLPAPAPALEAARIDTQERRFHPAVTGAARLWPHRFGTSGFFAALLRKTAAVPGEAAPAPQRPLDRTGFAPLPARQERELSAALLDRYGFDLPAVLAGQDLALLRRADTVYAVPGIYLTRFSALPVQSLGLEVGEYLTGKQEGFAPGHDWITRYHAQFKSGRLRLAPEQEPAWLRGEDLHTQLETGLPRGAIAIVESHDGRLLGRGRILADRVKNLLPRRMVL